MAVREDRLTPYVPRLVVDWLADEPTRLHRRVSGTCLFADISGFTSLTERLATRGKAGAEEMGDLLNGVFEQLLTPAYDHGATLIKWGGDAVLLLFDADDHALHAARAAWEMQEVMRSVGRLQTSAGQVRLGISIGIHAGDIDFLLVGAQHRELIVTGPGATMTARMEKISQPGQVILSPATALALPDGCSGQGSLLLSPPDIEPRPHRGPVRSDVDLGPAVCADLRDYLRGEVEQEHRSTTIGFIAFGGADDLLAERGSEELTDAVAHVVDATQEACTTNGVTFLASDLNENGGKLILTSGVPVSKGDAETRVLSTMRRVVHRGGRLSLAGGVTCGSVFAGDYGPAYRKTYSIAGDMVNLAARLMAKAGSGQVLATPTVVERSRTLFTTTALPPFAVKGKAEPIQAMAIGDLLRAPRDDNAGRLPLLGREVELRLLLAAAEEAAEGEGQVIEIVAAPGVGKSRLVEELCERVSARALWVDGDIYGSVTPYQPMHRLFRQTLALPEDVDPATLEAVLTDLVAGTAPHLLEWLPLIGVVAGVELPDTPAVATLDPEARRARLESATSELLGTLLDTPRVLVLNDTQFMDEATLGLMRRLALDVTGRPWLILVLRRADAEWPLGAMQYRTMALAPLAGDAAAALVAEATRTTPLPDYRVEQLVRHAGGNPLFLTQLISAAASGADLDALPDSVEGTIAAQIDRLPARHKRWLRAASVLGMSFDPAWLEEVLAGSDLADLRPEGLDDFISLHPDGWLHFGHHLIRLTAYEDLPYRRRTDLHERVSRVLESSAAGRPDLSSLLALHCLNGERYDAAWTHARQAGDRARAQHAVAEAARSYRLGLDAAEHLPDLDALDRAAVCERLADACADLGETDEVERQLRRARAAARGTPLVYARLCEKTAQHRQNVGRHQNATRWVTRGRAAIAGRRDRESLRQLALLAARAARVRQDQAGYRAARTWTHRAVDEATRARADDALAEARAVSLVLRAQAGERWDPTEVTETLALIERSGTQRRKSWTANAIGMSAYFAGEWDAARAYYAQAEQATRRIGHDVGAAVCAANQAEILVQQNRSTEARKILGPTLRTLRAAKASSFVSFALALLARAELIDGDPERAMDHLREAHELAVEMGETDEAVAIQAAVAECLLASGDAEEALRVVEETRGEVGPALDTLAALPALDRAHGRALVATGRAADGVRVLRGALGVALERGSDYEAQACLAALVSSEAAANGLEARGWEASRRQLAERLGILDGPAAPDEISPDAAAPSVG